METLASYVKHLTLAWIKAHVGTEGNEQTDQAAKEGAEGGSHLKETKTPTPWQTTKLKIEAYTTYEWENKWRNSEQFKHTKEFYGSPNKNKSKYVLKMRTIMFGIPGSKGSPGTII